jgi:hypothetical protein
MCCHALNVYFFGTAGRLFYRHMGNNASHLAVPIPACCPNKRRTKRFLYILRWLWANKFIGIPIAHSQVNIDRLGSIVKAAVV